MKFPDIRASQRNTVDNLVKKLQTSDVLTVKKTSCRLAVLTQGTLDNAVAQLDHIAKSL